jgi:hypothetical protein
MSVIIPSGTRIYLTRNPPYNFCIKPDTILSNQSFYVKYDVRQVGITVIPKGTRVSGDWIAESTPVIAAQLQIKKIYYERNGCDMFADSLPYEQITEFNNTEIENTSYLYNKKNYVSTANITRRLAKLPCKNKILWSDDLNTDLININTEEIIVTLTSDFDACACAPVNNCIGLSSTTTSIQTTSNCRSCKGY